MRPIGRVHMAPAFCTFDRWASNWVPLGRLRGSAFMIVRMNGQFGAATQFALRESFDWITGPVTIDLRNASLAAAALGEIMLLANRIGIRNVTLANPAPITRKILSVTHLDRVLRVTAVGDVSEEYQKSA